MAGQGRPGGRAPAAAALLALALALAASHGAAADDLLIKGGTVVNADRQFEADVLISGGLIAAVGPGLKAPKGARVIDAADKLVMPGGIDPHTHLDADMFASTSVDDFTSGQAAALAGGTTMHIDFALPTAHDMRAGLARYRQKAAGAVADYGFHMAVTRFDAQAAKDMAAVVADGVNSFKFFMAYKGSLQVTDAELLGGFQRCRQLGALPMVHAENGDAIEALQQQTIAAGITGPEGHYISRPDYLEDEATYRAIRLAEAAAVPLYVVHVMSAGAAQHVSDARLAGQRVLGEAIASGIAADEASVFHPDFKIAAQFVMSPPIRSAAHQARLQAALAGGGLQLVGTDHAPFNSTQKAAGLGDFRRIPNGVNGIEERMHVTWEVLVNSGLLTPPDFVRVTSTAAAQAFNIYPRKGLIAPGSDADVIVLDPAKKHTITAVSHHSAMDTNIYEGRAIRGKVVATVSQGKLVWDGAALRVTPGAGRFVRMPPFGPLFEGLEQQDAAALSRRFPYGPIPVPRAESAGSREEL